MAHFLVIESSWHVLAELESLITSRIVPTIARMREESLLLLEINGNCLLDCTSLRDSDRVLDGLHFKWVLHSAWQNIKLKVLVSYAYPSAATQHGNCCSCPFSCPHQVTHTFTECLKTAAALILFCCLSWWFISWYSVSDYLFVVAAERLEHW